MHVSCRRVCFGDRLAGVSRCCHRPSGKVGSDTYFYQDERKRFRSQPEVARHMGLLGARLSAGAKPAANTKMAQPSGSASHPDFIGLQFKKHFPGHGVFTGTVVRYDAASQFFSVRYEDGDCEELSASELSPLLVRDAASGSSRHGSGLEEAARCIQRHARGFLSAKAAAAAAFASASAIHATRASVAEAKAHVRHASASSPPPIFTS